MACTPALTLGLGLVILDKFPLPTVEELSAKFYGSTVSSKLDLQQGYLHVQLHPDSRNITAIVTHMGVFRYIHMRFGLSSAPSCFQKIMATIFSAILGVVVYLDDIVLHRETSVSQDKRLCWVLDAFSSHNLSLNGEKCTFATSDIECVGFRLISDGLSPLHPKVDAVLHLPEPPTLRRFHNFSG